MYPIIVSPPFGTYIRDSRITPVLGSFPLRDRPGRGLKIAQFALDNILHPVPGGWRNRIGLRHPGVGSIKVLDENFIYSIVGLEDQDWELIYHVLIEKERRGERVYLELNLGCQNVHVYAIPQKILERFCRDFTVIAKLPATPTMALAIAAMCVDAGVHYLHVGNTLPSEIGSLSGAPLKPVNLLLVEELANLYQNTIIIGGGGIYEWQDLLDYWSAGAKMFSLATIWFRPWKAKHIITKYQMWDKFFREDRDEHSSIIK